MLFEMAFRARKVSGTFEKRAPGVRFFNSSGKFYGPEKLTLKSVAEKPKKILRFETLHKSKLCLNANPVDIKSSVYK